MKKGIAGIIIVAAVGILVTGTTLLAGYLGIKKEFSMISRENEILSSINELEAIKQFLNVTLWYSFSQAIYDVSSTGGYYHDMEDIPKYNGIYFWRNGTSIFYPKYSEYLDDITQATLDIMNDYARSLGISEFSHVTIDPSKGVVHATSDKPLEKRFTLVMGNGNEIKVDIKDKKSTTAYFDPNVSKIYSVAKERYINNNYLEDEINKSIDDVCSKIDISHICASEPPYSVGEYLHNIVCNNWEKEINDKIKNGIENLNGKYDVVDITHRIDAVDAWYDTVSCEYEEGTINHCYCPDSGNINCINYTNVHCKYKNHAQAMVLVKVSYPPDESEKEKLFPVFDGKETKYGRITLQFYVNVTV